MANIKIPRKIFEKEVGKLTEEMQQKIAMFGTTLEKFDNEEMELEIFPNRPDLLSYHGFKRSFLTFLRKKTGLKKYEVEKPKKNYQVLVNPSVKKVRPFTACAIVKNLNLEEEKIKEIIDVQEKIHNTLGRKRKKMAIGIYPLEKIKLPIKYKAIEPDKIKFFPLDSVKEMTGLEILQRHPTGKEYAHLLAGKEKFPVFIDDNKQILSMPPIINSETVGKVSAQTRDVFVECSGFDLQILKKTLNIIVTTLAEMGGKIYSMEVRYPKKETTPDLSPQKAKISLENTNKLLGLNLNEKNLKTLLEKMGHNYTNKVVEIAPWRTDILHEIDLIEDIAIAYGYENFEPTIPEISTIGSENPKEVKKRKIAEILTGLKLLECSNYHLTNKENQFIKMGINEKQIKNPLEVIDSKTDYKILRENLTHYLLTNLSENVDEEYPQKIFEIGKVFENKNNIAEKEKLAIALTPGNFTEIKQVLEYLFGMLDKKIKIEEAKSPKNYFINGRTADIILNEKPIGQVGEIHPKILKNWKIKMPVSLFEIDLDDVLG